MPEAPAIPRMRNISCRLEQDEFDRFTDAAKRIGPGGASGQVRLLIREWLRSIDSQQLDRAA